MRAKEGEAVLPPAPVAWVGSGVGACQILGRCWRRVWGRSRASEGIESLGCHVHSCVLRVLRAKVRNQEAWQGFCQNDSSVPEPT